MGLIDNLFKKTPPKQANPTKIRELLSAKIPLNALDYAVDLWIHEPFSFTITNTRHSCLGNYSFKNGLHKITVNHDLNPYAFLITYLHEYAHLQTFLATRNQRKRALPHGEEWKRHFQKTMLPVLNDTVFPAEILKVLAKHMQNPAASSTADKQLQAILRKYDQDYNPNQIQKTVETIAIGEVFKLNNRSFKKLEVRRSRALCLCLENNRKYTVSLAATII